MMRGFREPVFELYAPTRTHDRVELRVRSTSAGPLRLKLGGAEHVTDQPRASRAGLHFYRHVFTGLESGTALAAEACLLTTDQTTRVRTSTLPAPPGRKKLAIGVLSDLHLGTERSSIDRFPRHAKRLYGLAHELGMRYIERLEALGVDVIVLPGDIVDPCNEATLALLRQMFESVKTPCYPIIGNHEPWTAGGERLFYRALGLPEGGYYSVEREGVKLLLLSTPTPQAISPGSPQWQWLKGELDAAPAASDIALFSHFSLLLHPCVQGANNDGYQLLHSHSALLRLLGQYPNVRLFAAGHKNVPSMLLHDGIVHTLSPQLIQAPMGYDVFQLYEHGLARTTYEIDEQHYAEVGREPYAGRYPERYGSERDRNFSHRYLSEQRQR